MQLTTLKELAWLHDCVLLSVLYDISSNSGRSISLTMRCPRDLGYAPWEDRGLVLVAIDVAVSKHVVCGFGRPETIDAVRPGISADVRESTMAARRMGVRLPSLEFTISLHSGSALEVVCQELQLEVV